MTDHTNLIAELRYVAQWAEHHLDKAKIVNDGADALVALQDEVKELRRETVGLEVKVTELTVELTAAELGLDVQAGSIEAVQAANQRLSAERDRLTEQCRLFDAAAYRSKVEAQTLVESAEARLTALEGQKPAYWVIPDSNAIIHDANVKGSTKGMTPLFLAAGAAPTGEQA